MKILIVDDSRAMQAIVRRAVIETGIEALDIQTASSGHDALNQVQSFKPDVVLTDLMMPGMDGFQLVRSLKSPNLGFDSLRLVVVSALSRQDIQNRGGLPESVDIFEKPIPFDRIEAIVLHEVQHLTASRARALAEAELANNLLIEI